MILLMTLMTLVTLLILMTLMTLTILMIPMTLMILIDRDWGQNFEDWGSELIGVEVKLDR